MCSWNRLQIHSDLHQFYIPPLSPAQVLNAIKCACWEAPQRHPQYPLITANTFGEQKGQRPFYRSLEKQQHVSIQKCIIIFICLSVMAVSPPPVITLLFLISYTVQESKIHAKVGTFLMRFIAYFWERTFCHWYKLLGGAGGGGAGWNNVKGQKREEKECTVERWERGLKPWQKQEWA